MYSAESGFYAHASAVGSQRDLLPWSSANVGNAAEGVSEEVKVERLRMLEREFGGASDAIYGKGLEEEANGIVGSVDEQGRLITAGPKKRVAVRVLQALFACGTAVSGIYGALVCLLCCIVWRKLSTEHFLSVHQVPKSTSSGWKTACLCALYLLFRHIFGHYLYVLLPALPRTTQTCETGEHH